MASLYSPVVLFLPNYQGSWTGDNGSWLGMWLTDTFCCSLFSLLTGSFAKLALRFDKSSVSDFLFYRLYFGGDVILDEMRGLGLLLFGACGYSAEPGQSIVKKFFPLMLPLCLSKIKVALTFNPGT